MPKIKFRKKNVNFFFRKNIFLFRIQNFFHKNRSKNQFLLHFWIHFFFIRFDRKKIYDFQKNIRRKKVLEFTFFHFSLFFTTYHVALKDREKNCHAFLNYHKFHYHKSMTKLYLLVVLGNEK